MIAHGWIRLKLLKLVLKCQRGATAIEYGLVAAGVAVAIITSVNLLGGSLSTAFTNIASAVDDVGSEDEGCVPPNRCGGPVGGPISDMRLKYDIHPMGTSMNGLKMYSFKYLGDNKTFFGVMAQDLLKDKKTASAVIVASSGFYAVDYRKLGIAPINGAQMMTSGYQAYALAASPLQLLQ